MSYEEGDVILFEQEEQADGYQMRRYEVEGHVLEVRENELSVRTSDGWQVAVGRNQVLEKLE